MVRVGGGFMHIEEFIDQYTPGEVVKVDRKDVLARFMQKTTIQKIADTADHKREISPIRSPQRPKSSSLR